MQQVPAEGHATKLRIDQDGPIAVVPGQPKQAVCPRDIGDRLREVVERRPRPARDRLEEIARAESPASMPVYEGCIEPGTTPQTPGIRSAAR